MDRSHEWLRCSALQQWLRVVLHHIPCFPHRFKPCHYTNKPFIYTVSTTPTTSISLYTLFSATVLCMVRVIRRPAFIRRNRRYSLFQHMI